MRLVAGDLNSEKLEIVAKLLDFPTDCGHSKLCSFYQLTQLVGGVTKVALDATNLEWAGLFIENKSHI